MKYLFVLPICASKSVHLIFDNFVVLPESYNYIKLIGDENEKNSDEEYRLDYANTKMEYSLEIQTQDV